MKMSLICIVCACGLSSVSCLTLADSRAVAEFSMGPKGVSGEQLQVAPPHDPRFVPFDFTAAARKTRAVPGVVPPTVRVHRPEPPGAEGFREDPEHLKKIWAEKISAQAYAQLGLAVQAIPDESSLPVSTRHVPAKPHATDSVDALAPETVWQQIGIGIDHDDDDDHDTTGRVTSLQYANDASQNQITTYAGTINGGLWKLVDLFIYAAWAPLSDNLQGSPSVGAFLVHPDDSNRILIGSGDYYRASGSGLYKTTDAGKTWQPRSLGSVPVWFRKILSNVQTHNTVLACGDGGIWRSVNFGDSWTHTWSGECSDLVENPDYPVIWHMGAFYDGILISFDDGQSFQEIAVADDGSGLTGTISRISLATAISSSNYLYALIADGNDNTNGIYRSDDYGYHWKNIESGSAIEGVSQAFHVNAIGVSPTDPDFVVVGEAYAKYTRNATSTNPTWTDMDGGHADYTSFTFVPNAVSPNNTQIAVTNDGGHYIFNYNTNTVNGQGNTLGMVASETYYIGSLGGTTASATTHISGLQDNGMVRIDSSSSSSVSYVGGGDGGLASISPDSAERWYFSSGGGFSRYWKLSAALDWVNVDCTLTPTDIAAMVADPSPGYGDQVYTYTKTVPADFAGAQDLRVGPINAAETVTVAKGTQTAVVSLASGDQMQSVVDKFNAKVSALQITADANWSGEIELYTNIAGSANSFQIKSTRANVSGSAGIGTATIAVAGADSYVWSQNSTLGTCGWQRVHATPLPSNFSVQTMEVAPSTAAYVIYLTGANDRRLYVMDSSVSQAPPNLGYVNRTPSFNFRVQPTTVNAFAFADHHLSQGDTVYYVYNFGTDATGYGMRLARSDDRGVSWKDVSGNIYGVPGLQGRRLIGTPGDPNVMYVGTNAGVFRTDDGGAHWYGYKKGLPAMLDVYDMEYSTAVTPNVLTIASRGRGFWKRVISGVSDRIFADDFE